MEIIQVRFHFCPEVTSERRSMIKGHLGREVLCDVTIGTKLSVKRNPEAAAVLSSADR